MNVGMVGMGVVGNAMVKWIRRHNKKAKLFFRDPVMGMNDDFKNIDVVFIQIPVLNLEDGFQDISNLLDAIRNTPNVPTFIRSTILPSSYDEIVDTFRDREIFYMPEFLSNDTAVKDFETEPIFCTGKIKLLRKLFKDKQIVKSDSRTAILAKYAHNCLGAALVTYFTALEELSAYEGVEYKNILKILKLTDHFKLTYSTVPGKHGRGYAGKCFPKDVDALNFEYEDRNIGKIMKTIADVNSFFREGISSAPNGGSGKHA